MSDNIPIYYTLNVEAMVLWFSIMALTEVGVKQKSSAMRTHKWFKYQF